MKSTQHIPDVLKSINAFVGRSLKGRYRAYAADRFLILLLQYEFYRQYASCKDISQSAHTTGQLIFEVWLQQGCGAETNGAEMAERFVKCLKEN